MAYRSKRNAGTRHTLGKGSYARNEEDNDISSTGTDDTDQGMQKTRGGLPRIDGARNNDGQQRDAKRTDGSYRSRIPIGSKRVPNANRNNEPDSVTPVRERFRARENREPNDLTPRKDATGKARINISKKVTFYRNGDKHFKGRTLIITRQKYGSFESLEEDLSKRIPLPYGVRYVFSPGGHLVTNINQLDDGGFYICSSGDRFIHNIDYGVDKRPKPDPESNNIDRTNLSVPSDNSSNSSSTGSPRSSSNEAAKPRVITIYNSQDKAVKCKILLNRKTTKTYEDILKDISEMMKLKGQMQVKELYTENSIKVGGLSEMFRGPEVFFAVTAVALPAEKPSKRNLSNPSSQSSNSNEISPPQSRKTQSKSRKKLRREPQGPGSSTSLTVRVKGKKLTYFAPTNNERLIVDEDDEEAYSPPDAKPQLHWVYGYQGKDTQHNLHVLPSGYILYFISRVVVIYYRKTNAQRHYTGHADDIKCMAVHPNQWYVATGQASGLSLDQNEMSHIRIWDAETLITLAVLSLDDYSLSIAALAFSVEDNGKQLVCFDSSGDTFKLSLWEWEDRHRMVQSKELTTPVLDISFDPDDSKTIVSCGKEHIYFWRWHNGKLERKNGYFEKYPVPHYLTCIDFAPNGDVCTGDSNGCIMVWGKASKKIKFVVRNAHEKSILCLRMLNNGTLLTSGGVDGRVCSWDANKFFNTPINEVQLPDDLTGISACEPLLSGHGDDVTLLVGTTANTILEGSFTDDFTTLVKGHRDEVPCLAVHPTDDRFISASLDKIANLWSATDHQTIWSIDVEFPIRSAAFYTTGSVVAFGTTRGRWVVLNVQTGMHVASFQDGTEPLTDVEYSPDGEHIAVGSKDGNIYVHSVYDDGMTYRRVGCCSNHTAPVMFLDWSVDGCFIQSISTEYEHITWEIGAFQREESQNVIRDTEWNTRNVVLGYDVGGVWQSTPTEENLVSSSDLSWSHDLLAIGDELGYIRLFRYPCCNEGAQYHQVRAHSTSVARVMFLASDKFLLSTAGQDCAVMQWSLEGKLDPVAEEREEIQSPYQSPARTPEAYSSEQDDYTSADDNDRRNSDNDRRNSDNSYSDDHYDREYYSGDDEPTGFARRKDYNNTNKVERDRHNDSDDRDRDRSRRVHSDGLHDRYNASRKDRNPTSYSEGDERAPRGKRDELEPGILGGAQKGRHHRSTEDVGRNRAPQQRKSFEEDMFKDREEVENRQEGPPRGRGRGREPLPRGREPLPPRGEPQDIDEAAVMIPQRRLIRQNKNPPPQKGGYAAQRDRHQRPAVAEQERRNPPLGRGRDRQEGVSGSYSEESAEQEERDAERDSYGGRAARGRGRKEGYGGRREGYARRERR